MKGFRDEAHDRLMDESGDLERPALVHGAFDDAFFSARDVVAMLRYVAEHEAFASTLRVYQDGGMKPALARRLLSTPPGADDDLLEWARRHLGPAPFGIVLDRPPLVAGLDLRVGAWLERVYDRIGCPLGGAEPHVFVGDYEWTPFGVHHDEEVGRVVHFHAGPGDKHLHLWSTEDFVAASGGTAASFDPEPLLPRSTHHALRTGDAFVLPTDGYHVGRTEGFSVALAICLAELTERDLVRRALAPVLDESLEAFAPEGRAPRIRQTARAASPGRGALALGVDEAVRLYEARLLSNLGLWPAAPERDVGDELPADSRVVRAGRFPLRLVSHEGDEVTLCARGHTMRLPAAPALEELVERVNLGEPFAVDEAVERLGQCFEPEAASFIVVRLLACCSLELVSPADGSADRTGDRPSA